MKYSFKLGQYHSKADLSKILSLSEAELAEKLNSQIGAFDEIINWVERYEGVYIAKIAKLEKHPDADKLNVCLIDDGGAAKKTDRNKDGLVQVVCGASNAKEGMTVAWVSPGSTVPSTFSDKEPFVLSKIKLRGVESNGMLASEKELSISEDHDGILDIEDGNLKPGTQFRDLFDLDDIIVDFENKMFTHRPDCFGNIGIAREIAGIQAINFESPDWYKEFEPKPLATKSKLKVNVVNEAKEVVPRYTAICIEGIKVQPSPIWLKSYLMRLGIRPINNVVDITNYMMILTGQPLHAFDFDKVKSKSKDSAVVTIRLAKKDEKLKILGGKEISLDQSDIVITDGNKPIALGGVMGGANSEVDQNTTSIILESANFNMYSIRRTSMRHGLFTDAVTRFTKGQPEFQTALVLNKAVQMYSELIPEVKYGDVTDLNSTSFEDEHLTIKVEKINKILGLNLSREQISEILNYVEIYSHEMLDEVCVTPPFWRKDLEIDEDVIEEIGRLYGFNNIDDELPTRKISPAKKSPMIKLKSEIRSKLSALGANEVLTYNFVSDSLLKKAEQDPQMAYKIRNALSPELQRYRLSLIPNLLEKVNMNIKASEDEFALFEIGKCHVKDHLEKGSKLPLELQRLSFVYANKSKTEGSPYFVAKRYLEELLNTLNIEYRFTELGKEMFGPKIPISSVYFEGSSAGLEIKDGDKYELRGIIGEFRPEVSINFKLPESCAGFELDLGLISEKFSLDPKYVPLSRFPSISQDITLEASSAALFSDIDSKLKVKLKSSTKSSGVLFQVRPISIFQKNEPKELEAKKSFTFSIEFWHPEKTLTTSQINELMQQIKL